MVQLSNVDKTSDSAKPVSNATQAALDLKASSASVTASLSALIGGAPDALNTLNELAAAIGSDPSYSATLLTALNGKQVKFVHGTLPASNAARLFEMESNKFRGIACSSPLTVSTEPGSEAYLTLFRYLQQSHGGL